MVTTVVGQHDFCVSFLHGRKLKFDKVVTRTLTAPFLFLLTILHGLQLVYLLALYLLAL